MRIVVSFGYAALRGSADVFARRNRQAGVQVAARGLHALLDAGHELVVTHPHERPVTAWRDGSPVPPEASSLELQEARADGLTGYLLEQALRSLRGASERSFATIVTHVLVDAHDPAFAAPTRDVGGLLDGAEARRLERTLRWTTRPEGHYRQRVVAEPDPSSVLQHRAIAMLAGAGHTVLCSGGGIAVMRDAEHRESGAEALVDPDLGASLLAREIGAHALLLATDVGGVQENWPAGRGHPLHRLPATNLDLERFEVGTMRPKLDAAARFARHGGRAVIGSIERLADMVEGRAGTSIED